ncbi:hypothetical protein C810_01516 [Lachnospiraceae bacterium A2]|nr:hypothetical protein C810_01516 [Lachnospiraceae bacterium A2]
MSMISEQVKELRIAAVYKEHSLKILLEQAANTIEALSAKLAAANMERSDRYYGCGWISVEDRLPESYTEIVLVCLKNGAVSVAINTTDGNFVNMMVGASRQKFRSFPEHNPVIAWQPLPEPYCP